MNNVLPSLPSSLDSYNTDLTPKAIRMPSDPTHPSHSLVSLLPSEQRPRSLQAKTSRLKGSFIHHRLRKLNFLPALELEFPKHQAGGHYQHLRFYFEI